MALGWAVTPLLLFYCGDIAFCRCDMVFISCGIQRVSLAQCQSKWVMCCVQLVLSAGTSALLKRKASPKHGKTPFINIYSRYYICLFDWQWKPIDTSSFWEQDSVCSCLLNEASWKYVVLGYQAQKSTIIAPYKTCIFVAIYHYWWKPLYLKT